MLQVKRVQQNTFADLCSHNNTQLYVFLFHNCENDWQTSQHLPITAPYSRHISWHISALINRTGISHFHLLDHTYQLAMKYQCVGHANFTNNHFAGHGVVALERWQLLLNSQFMEEERMILNDLTLYLYLQLASAPQICSHDFWRYTN